MMLFLLKRFSQYFVRSPLFALQCVFLTLYTKLLKPKQYIIKYL